MPVSGRDREQAREDFEQLVTDILVALSDAGDGDRLILRDGPDVDDARRAVMRELLAHWELRHAAERA